MTKAKKKKRTDVCCDRFYEAYVADEISHAYEEHSEIDETEWFISGLWHLYFCPFCGTSIVGVDFHNAHTNQMKIEFDKIVPPYSFPVSAADAKEIVSQCIPPEILPRVRKIHFGCNQQTTQEARIVGRGSSFEIRINFCLKEGKTKLLSDKREWCDLVEFCGGKIDKQCRTVAWKPDTARTYTGFLIAHEVAHIAYAERNGQSGFGGKSSASEEAWCELFAKGVARKLKTST